VQPHDQGPSALAWLAALISLALPWVGVAAGLLGLWHVARGERSGWWYVAAGGGMLIADICIDFIWAHAAARRTDQPDLNRRAAQLVGRVAVVEEAIEHGRGKVRIGDTLWLVEGPDLPCGAEVRVRGARGALLEVERA
jgi:membrane protein implicated in regulation of membrane protease activity